VFHPLKASHMTHPGGVGKTKVGVDSGQFNCKSDCGRYRA